MDKNPILQFDGVNFAYDSENIIKDISFGIDRGDFVAIIGPNGAGKTTIIKLILEIISPNSGKITREFNNDAIGYVPQQVAQRENNFPATVFEIVLSGSYKKNRTQCIEALEATDTFSLKDKLISELSGGQRQRAFIARALACNPEILLLDEPETGIDIKQEKEFYKFLAELNKVRNTTIIMISHNIEAIRDTVKSIICINRNMTCHIESKDFDHSKYINEMYDENYNAVHHLH